MSSDSIFLLSDISSVGVRPAGKVDFLSPMKFIESPPDIEPGRCIVIETKANEYMGVGYHAALIAEARGYSVFPTADEMFRASPPLAEAHGVSVVSSLFNTGVVPKTGSMVDAGLPFLGPVDRCLLSLSAVSETYTET